MSGKDQLAGPNESVETLDEISKKTLGSYVKNASSDKGVKEFEMGYQAAGGIQPSEKEHKEVGKRRKGIAKAIDRLTKEDVTEAELDEMISEVLSKSAEAGEWIKDFVNSENPKFAGKSKEKRKQMALAAYYAKQNESLDEAELGAEGDFKKASKKFVKAPTQDKQGKPEGSLEVKEDLDESIKKNDWVTHVDDESKVGKVTNVSGDKSSVDVKWNNGKEDSHPAEKIKHLKEALDEELLDELSKATLSNYVKDASSDRAGNSFTMGYEAGAGRQPKEKAHEYDAKRRKGISRAVTKLAKESFADFIFGGEVIREELTYELSEADKNYDAYFKEMMKKAGISSIGDLKTDDAKKEFMNSVDTGFKAKNEDTVIENFMRADVEDKAEAHKKAGHKVSDIKFSTKDNKPHAEYVVTTSAGDKKKYIYHGTARKLETLA